MNVKVSPVLSISHLTLDFILDGKSCHAVNEVSFSIYPGEIVAVVGESGCGKTQLALTCLGLQPPSAVVRSGTIHFEEEELLSFSPSQWNAFRGTKLSMIFQEPMTALNPLVKVGKQIAENAMIHGLGRGQARILTMEMMEKVGLPDPLRLYSCYPHQLSGGMRQRIMIAMALINSPSLLIADEPTTALDVTIQNQIMELIKTLNRDLGTAVLLISHDLGVVRHTCTRLFVMYAGSVVESGPTAILMENPLHPYTKGLIASIPDITLKDKRLDSIPGMVPPLGQRKIGGCAFYNRCSKALPCCGYEEPPICKMVDGQSVACHLYVEAWKKNECK
jgi:oligopeptide/dipeptide ABC transporter ATP-binding protein